MIGKPAYKIVINGVDVSTQVGSEVLELTYLDRVEGESDELELHIEDKSGRWRNSWYPKKGSQIELFLGLEGQLDPCGFFEVDEIETNYNSAGFRLKIKALSALISAPFRTKRHQRYTNISLRKLATTIAARGQMTVSGNIEDINFKSISQHNETDLGFLRRVADSYGYIFSIKSRKLVFTNIGKLQARAPVRTLTPEVISELNIIDATDRTFKVGKQTYWDPDTGKTIQYESNSSDAANAKNDIFEMEGYVENAQQAELKAKAAIKKSENNTVTCSVSLSRSVGGILAGNNVEIIKVGVMSGIYHIESSSHVVTKSGGSMIDFTAFRIALVDASKQ